MIPEALISHHHEWWRVTVISPMPLAKDCWGCREHWERRVLDNSISFPIQRQVSKSWCLFGSWYGNHSRNWGIWFYIGKGVKETRNKLEKDVFLVHMYTIWKSNIAIESASDSDPSWPVYQNCPTSKRVVNS